MDNVPADDEFPFEQKDSEGNFTYTKSPIGSNDEYLSPEKRKTQKALNEYLSAKAESRQDKCWCFDCSLNASVWVREIQFDMKGDKVGVDHHVVSTSDYDGPIPGFCFAHVANGPAQLAETVYWDRTEIYMGLRPRKWWVIFTDGTKQGGLCQVLNPKNLKPSTHDLHIKSTTN